MLLNSDNSAQLTNRGEKCGLLHAQKNISDSLQAVSNSRFTTTNGHIHIRINVFCCTSKCTAVQSATTERYTVHLALADLVEYLLAGLMANQQGNEHSTYAQEGTLQTLSSSVMKFLSPCYFSTSKHSFNAANSPSVEISLQGFAGYMKPAFWIWSEISSSSLNGNVPLRLWHTHIIRMWQEFCCSPVHRCGTIYRLTYDRTLWRSFSQPVGHKCRWHCAKTLSMFLHSMPSFPICIVLFYLIPLFSVLYVLWLNVYCSGCVCQPFNKRIMYVCM